MCGGKGEEQDLLWFFIVEETANTHVNSVLACDEFD